jgi:hypothetical protein
MAVIDYNASGSKGEVHVSVAIPTSSGWVADMTWQHYTLSQAVVDNKTHLTVGNVCV